ncbi:MAG: Ycf66 family protein [Pleurocapsa sp.]
MCINAAEYIEQSTDGVRKMLSYALAIAVALSSFVLFLTAFFMSDIHRKDDFLWSAMGLFYALVLWFCARNITGAVLLGQASAAVLLISFTWQTLKLRKAVATHEKAIAINNFSVLQAINGFLSRGKKNKPQVTATTTPSVKEAPDVVTESEIAIPQTTSTKAKSSTSSIPSQKTSRGGGFGKMFSKKKEVAITNTKLDEVLDRKPAIETEVPAESKIKAADIPPQVSTPDNQKTEPDTVKSSPEKPPEINRESKIANKNKEISNKEDTTINSPEVIEPKKPSPTEEIEAVKNEVIENQTIENQTADLPDVETTVEIKPETSIDTEETINSAEDIIPIDSEQKTEIAPIEVEPEAENPLDKTEAIEPETNQANKDRSALDSLETVEVAEVLDALPENPSEERDRDRSDIIEVTTTDIDQAIEPEQQDRNSSSNTQSD